MHYRNLFNVLLVAQLALVACTSTQAQEMPPGGVIVNTACEIAEGHSVDEVIAVARAVGAQTGEGGPNFVFYRRPIGGGNFSPNFLLRTVYWDSVEHWASGPGPGPSGPRNHLAEILDCDNVNRSFWTNRGVNQGNAYAGGENRETLMAARRCRMKPGSTLEELYARLQELDAPYARQGDTTLMQLSHQFVGPSNGEDMGTLVTIRLVGEDEVGLARRMDMATKYVGTPADSPLENCGNWVMFTSYVTTWNP